MGIARVLCLIAAAGVMAHESARAGNLCPAAPFETDVHTIAAAIAAEPLRPAAWYADMAIACIRLEADRLTDGAAFHNSGGLMRSSAASLEYDAKRYVLVYLDTEWPSRLDFGRTKSAPPKPIPNQVVRKVGDVTYITTIARPTPEDAREFACLANRLLGPTRPKPPPAIYEPPSDPTLPIEVTVTASRPGPRCAPPQFTDGYMESFGLLSSRPGFSYDADVPCDIQADLESHIKEVLYAPINEVFERGKGTWEPPRIHALAFDATDNLYLLLDPGTHRRRHIEIRKITPSGEAVRLTADIGGNFYGRTFIVDRPGHVWVPVSENSETVIYDAISDTGNRWFGESYPARRRAPFESIAVDMNDNLYAASGSEIFKITPTGAVTQLADLDVRHQRVSGEYFQEQFHLAVAPEATVFVSDATSNVIAKMSADGGLAIVAGIPGEAGTTDGPGYKARFNAPRGLVLDRQGNLYVTDSGNHTIRRITPSGQVSTFAGKNGKRATVDGLGTSARFDSPASIAIDSAGVLYVTNGTDNLIRKVSPAGAVSTVNAQRFIDLE
jgi:hypothetical protein